MNGTADADTIADPSVFFSLLCTFAAGLDAAHADNVAADKVWRASCPTSAAIRGWQAQATPWILTVARDKRTWSPKPCRS